MRIAMWSGPRNLSTAMMRSFGARADCAVLDEPFYAAYLAKSGIDHPMRADVLASQPYDPEVVARNLLGPVPGGSPVWYQKHMPHHMLPGFPRDWFAACRHAILIRAPERVAASFDAGRPRPTLEDLGAPQMDGVIADIESATGRTPPVIEAEDVRANPEGMLRALCAALDIPFDARMLSWPSGPRASDGVWAAHWYKAVVASTGFAPPSVSTPKLAPYLAEVAARARPGFERLRARKLKPL
ncbi:HAD family hydrolase [Pikeienuella piscinae]|uniref:HAD family hydrolase n=1 Tax=Pikeienuella piscinae TaxID=2748098 RepID=A0A7M3T711_9RHOB|nr:HAD family hydrolase [Pikeienuella piscinae]